MESARYLVLVVIGALALTGIVAVLPTDTASVAGDMAEAEEKLKDCETLCRQRFGGDEWVPPPVRGAEMIAYSNCILKCRRQFWKDYDKDTEKLERSKP